MKHLRHEQGSEGSSGPDALHAAWLRLLLVMIDGPAGQSKTFGQRQL